MTGHEFLLCFELDEGEYFGDAKMRERDPLLFEQYIGSAAVPVFRPRKLSETILQNAEEEEIRARKLKPYLLPRLKNGDFSLQASSGTRKGTDGRRGRGIGG